MKSPPHLSLSLKANGFLFLSGQLAFGDDGKLVGSTISEQTTKTFDNILNVLGENGLSLEDIVKVTIWLTDTKDFAEFNDTYAAILGDHKPARSTVCSALMLPDALVEIEVIAALS